MIEKSIFDEETLINFVKNNYNINVLKCKKIDRGSANLYILNDDYILKEYQSKYDETVIEKETIVINHLNKKGVKVPEIIQNNEGKLYTIYEGRIILIEKYIQGTTKSNNEGTLDECLDSAHNLAMIILNLEDLDIQLPESDVIKWFSEEKINKSIQKYNDLLLQVSKTDKNYKVIYEDLTSKINMLKNIRNTISVDELKNLTIKNTHGDYNVLQFIYEEDKIKAVIDFAAATKMPIVWEIVRSYSYIDEKAKNATFDIDNLVEYIKEFNKYIKLNEYDLKYMVNLYLIQTLHSDYGYKQYINDTSKQSLLEFGLFRTKLCKYMFENKDLISNTLIEKIMK